MKNEYIRKEDAEMLFRNARKNLLEEARKGNITDVNTRDLMLLNAEQMIHLLPSIQMESEWIPVNKDLPKNTDPVNITWVNHKPESYYADIKDKPFTATGCYCDGKWYWYSVTCQDYLDEYHYCDVDSMDEEIEVIAWQPLPEPYKESEG